MHKRSSRLGFLICLSCFATCIAALSSNPFPPRQWAKDVARGYKIRVEADPSFPMKSVVEVFVAASTQFAAEYQRRGAQNLLSEMDFVLSGILTAVYGKYASMWKVARTAASSSSNQEIPEKAAIDQEHREQPQREPHLGSMKVPTNAFQPFLLDGVTRPSLAQRLGSFVVPIVPLFQAGVFAGIAGYGFTFILIALRSMFMPSYVAHTKNVNIIHASLYTGCFMAVVSNVRYQLMQGVLEPTIDRTLRNIPVLRALAIFIIRFANGFLGSMLAIAGMKALGLQKLK